ncbi:MAG: class I SAM-dependent methyltransferase [Mycobacterium sp.]
MFERLKTAARDKLQRAVAEVVEDEHARSQRSREDLHAEVLAEVDRLVHGVTERLGDVGARIDEVIRRQNELEFRARRDIWYAQDLRVTDETATFVFEHMPKAAVFWHPHDTLRFALGEIKGPGMALEFGVATGTTLAIIADTVAGDRAVFGFDSFEGLPETWRTGFETGEFAQQPPRDIPGATLVTGLFEDSLPAFLAEHDEPVAFAHLDADLYSSTKTVLDLLGDRLAPDAVLLFDEFFNYPGWQRHEYKAFQEFLARTSRTFEYLGYTGNNEQVAIRLH